MQAVPAHSLHFGQDCNIPVFLYQTLENINYTLADTSMTFCYETDNPEATCVLYLN